MTSMRALVIPVLAAALCGQSNLAVRAAAQASTPAPGCRRTDRPVLHPPADTGRWRTEEDVRANAAYLCTLRQGRAPVRLILAADRDGNPVEVRVYGTARGGRPVQVLALDDAAGAPPRGSAFFQGVDLNRDGWMDLKVLTAWGATGNQAFDVFMYQPARGRFARDSVLTREGDVAPVAGRPCVATHWHMNVDVYSNGEYCWTRGRWVLVRLESTDYLPRTGARGDPILAHTVRELRGGRLRTVRVDTGGPVRH